MWQSSRSAVAEAPIAFASASCMFGLASPFFSGSNMLSRDSTRVHRTSNASPHAHSYFDRRPSIAVLDYGQVLGLADSLENTLLRPKRLVTGRWLSGPTRESSRNTWAKIAILPLQEVQLVECFNEGLHQVRCLLLPESPRDSDRDEVAPIVPGGEPFGHMGEEGFPIAELAAVIR